MDNKNPYQTRFSTSDDSFLQETPSWQWTKLLRFFCAGIFGVLLCSLLICLEAGGYYWFFTIGPTTNDARVVDQVVWWTMFLVVTVLMYTLPVSFFVSGTMAVTCKFGSGLYVGFLGSLVATNPFIIMNYYNGVRTGVVFDALVYFIVSLIPLICCGILSKKLFAKYE